MGRVPDWAGAAIPVHDPLSGEIWPASLFVMVLGASSYTYTAATRDQQLTAWLSCHMHAFEYFGGVPRLLVPDNPRTGVSRACRYQSLKSILKNCLDQQPLSEQLPSLPPPPPHDNIRGAEYFE